MPGPKPPFPPVSDAEPIRLSGKLVTLRPFRADELSAVWRNSRGERGHESAPSARERATWLERVTARGAFVEERIDLAIDADGRLIGEIEARRCDKAMPPGVYELGIALFQEGSRRRGFGSEAIGLLASLLFDRHDAGRVQASTAITNDAMRRSLEKSGFRDEGTMHAYMPGPDGREDYEMYSLTRAEWEARK